jgi:hypothetical protein
MQQAWKCTTVFISFTITLLFMMNGCSNSSSQKESTQEHEATAVRQKQQKAISMTPVFAVIGADISGSYELLTSKALVICKSLVLNANPGDELFIRTISDKSYPPSNAIAHAKFIAVPPVPNRFNKTARRRYARAVRTFQAQKRRLAQKLEQMTFYPASQTDIYGFIAAASDLFENAPAENRKVLMFATDLKDTAGLKCNPDLSDVEVIVFEFLVDASPIASQKRRDSWAQQLKAWGAVKVTIRPAS